MLNMAIRNTKKLIREKELSENITIENPMLWYPNGYGESPLYTLSVKITDEMRQLVREEVKSRTNSDVIFFRTGRYSTYGTPMFKEDDHYFSSY